MVAQEPCDAWWEAVNAGVESAAKQDVYSKRNMYHVTVDVTCVGCGWVTCTRLANTVST